MPMFRLYLRNPKTQTMEIHYVETATETERMVLKAWPNVKISASGEAVVRTEREVANAFGPVIKYGWYLVGRIEFQDKV